VSCSLLGTQPLHKTQHKAHVRWFALVRPLLAYPIKMLLATQLSQNNALASCPVICALFYKVSLPAIISGDRTTRSGPSKSLLSTRLIRVSSKRLLALPMKWVPESKSAKWLAYPGKNFHIPGLAHNLLTRLEFSGCCPPPCLAPLQFVSRSPF